MLQLLLLQHAGNLPLLAAAAHVSWSVSDFAVSSKLISLSPTFRSCIPAAPAMSTALVSVLLASSGFALSY